MFKFRLLALVATLLTALALSACTTAKPQTPAPAAPPEPAKLIPVTVRLDWSPNAIHAPIYAALEKGFYKAEGLDVKVNPATATDDVIKLVDSGVDTIGVYYQSSALKSQAKGYNIKVFGAYVQHALNVVMVDQRAGIKSLKDLEGKTVGFTDDPRPKGSLSTTAASLKAMVEKVGGNFDKITLVNVGEVGIQSLASQKIHALGGVYEYHEKYLLDKEGIKTDVYRLHEHGAPDFYELVLIASAKTGAEQGDMLKKFLKATEMGVQYAREKPDEVADMVVKADPTLKKEMVRSGLNVVLPLFQDSGKPFGAQDQAKWESAAKWMLDNKLISAAPAFDKLLTK